MALLTVSKEFTDSMSATGSVALRENEGWSD
jgi:hypothetical protein